MSTGFVMCHMCQNLFQDKFILYLLSASSNLIILFFFRISRMQMAAISMTRKVMMSMGSTIIRAMAHTGNGTVRFAGSINGSTVENI